MGQASETLKTIVRAILPVRMLWPFLLLLAAFVIFFQFIADVGGSADPLSQPSRQPTPAASPTPTTYSFPDAGLVPAGRAAHAAAQTAV